MGSNPAGRAKYYKGLAIARPLPFLGQRRLLRLPMARIVGAQVGHKVFDENYQVAAYNKSLVPD